MAGNVRQAPIRLLATAVGGFVGGIIAAGPWAWMLWQTFGNPLFPYFNQIFQSPDASPVPYNDARFIPHGLDAWLTVFHFTKRSFLFSEARLADPRILLGLIALGMTLLLQKRRGWPSRGVTLLAVFCVVTLVAWTNLYGIYRYLVGVELLCAVALAGTLTTFLPARWPRYGLLIALVVVFGVTKRPNWGRTHPFTTPMVQVQFPPLADDALVVISTDAPVGHAVAFLPRNVPAISVANNFMRPQQCTGLQAAAEARIHDHQGAFYLLRETKTDLSDSASNAYQHYGLELEGACQPIVDSLRPLELCTLHRARSVTPLCPFPAHDRPADR
jgi:hypothetical protein